MNSKSKILFIVTSLLLLCDLGLYFVFQAWMPFMVILLIAVVIGYGCFIYFERNLLREFMYLKTTQQSMSMGLMLVIVAVILAASNYLSVKLAKTYDLSIQQIHTLSDQSKKILDHLDSEIELNYFYKNGLDNIDQDRKSFLKLSKVYENYSSQVKVNLYEMNSYPDKTELFKASRGTGEAFVYYKGKINRIEIYSEEGVTNAIIKSTRKRFKNIYFLSGHGEASLDDTKSEKAITELKAMLEKNSYNVKPFSFTDPNLSLNEADVLVIVNPQSALLKAEMNILKDFINSGKPVLIYLDAQGNLEELISSYGLRIASGYVFNIVNTAKGPMVATEDMTVASLFNSESEITKYFDGSKKIISFRPKPLEIKQPLEGVQYLEILKTSAQSVSLSDTKTVDQTAQPKSHTLGIQLKGKKNMIIFSTASMIDNGLLGQATNKELVLNALSYLAKETDLIALPPKEVLPSKMKLTALEFNNYFKYSILAFFLPLPFVFLIVSLFLWLRRRHA